MPVNVNGEAAEFSGSFFRRRFSRPMKIARCERSSGKIESNQFAIGTPLARTPWIRARSRSRLGWHRPRVPQRLRLRVARAFPPQGQATARAAPRLRRVERRHHHRHAVRARTRLADAGGTSLSFPRTEGLMSNPRRRPRPPPPRPCPRPRYRCSRPCPRFRRPSWSRRTSWDRPLSASSGSPWRSRRILGRG